MNMGLDSFIDNALLFLNNWGFILVIVFGIAHGLIDNPWSFLTLSLALSIMSIPLAYAVVLLSNYLGSALQYFLLHYINNKSNNYFYQKKVSKKILVWFDQQPIWKHIIVIGMPLVPTIPLRIALPFTKMSFQKYMVIIGGTYLFLYAAYTLVYFGIISFITDNVSEFIGIPLLIVFCLWVYFGKQLRDKLFKTNQLREDIVHEN
jgi:uncharacterized membrane protein YdjX (TVP38/TMEM64 family)